MAYRALVIEDDGTIADVLRMKLNREGHEVTVAPTQRDAYHLLGEKSFDFALLDLRLPTHEGDMSPHVQVGFDILGYIRERFSANMLPVIVMTAYEETSQTAVRALRAGANDYITKPFDDSPVSLDEKLRDIVACIGQTRLATAVPGVPKAHTLVFCTAGPVELDSMVVSGCSADLLRVLGTRTLMLSPDAAGARDPRMTCKDIAVAMDVNEPTVRQYVARFRRWVATEYKRRGLGPIDRQAIIRNRREWKGYDLNLDSCQLSVK
jgi:DNA-binding response OmpR family regulator